MRAALGLSAAIAAAAALAAPASAQELSTIDWEAVDRDARAQGLESGRPSRSVGFTSFEGVGDSADNLTIPVLLPQPLIEAGRRNQLDQPLELLAGVNNYSAEAQNAPRSYLVQGTRVFFESVPAVGDEGADDPAPATQEVVLTRTLYGVEASFERYGAVYSVTIFCADPARDPECAEDSTIRFLAAQMILAP